MGALNRDDAAPVDCRADADVLVDEASAEVKEVVVEEEVEEEEVVEPAMKKSRISIISL